MYYGFKGVFRFASITKSEKGSDQKTAIKCTKWNSWLYWI